MQNLSYAARSPNYYLSVRVNDERWEQHLGDSRGRSLPQPVTFAMSLQLGHLWPSVVHPADMHCKWRESGVWSRHCNPLLKSLFPLMA